MRNEEELFTLIKIYFSHHCKFYTFHDILAKTKDQHLGRFLLRDLESQMFIDPIPAENFVCLFVWAG